MLKKLREPVNSISHFLGSIFAFLGVFSLFLKAKNFEQQISCLIFSVTMFLMFFSSALYHAVNAKDKIIVFLRKLDHSMIALFIAGTYTPLCLITLKGKVGLIFLIVIWFLAVVSILISLFFIHAPRWLSTGVYLLMGWVAIFGIKYVYMYLGTKGFIWLVIGGLSYTVGAIIYALKKPNFSKNFGFHELWHIFVVGGALSHYIMVYSYVIN